MIQDFIECYAKLLVSDPNSVKVEILSSTDDCDELHILVNPDDIGKIIGKDGKMINAIKSVISGCKAKGGKNYRISVHPIH